MSWGPVVWVLLGEMFPNRIRAAALGLAAAGAVGRRTARSLCRSRRCASTLGVAYGFYAVCAVLSFFFVWRWVEETKGMHLEDMHREASTTRHIPPGTELPRARRETAVTLLAGAWNNRVP